MVFCFCFFVTVHGYVKFTMKDMKSMKFFCFLCERLRFFFLLFFFSFSLSFPRKRESSFSVFLSLCSFAVNFCVAVNSFHKIDSGTFLSIRLTTA